MRPIAADRFSPGLYVGAFLFGLAAMPVYALSVAHMNDFVEPDGFVEASSGMLMVYAVGAIIGPMLASWATRAAGVDLLFPYIAVVYVGFAVVVVFRMRARPALPPAERQDFVATPGTSRSEEHTSELQSLMRISYAVFCLKKKTSNIHVL